MILASVSPGFRLFWIYAIGIPLENPEAHDSVIYLR